MNARLQPVPTPDDNGSTSTEDLLRQQAELLQQQAQFLERIAIGVDALRREVAKANERDPGQTRRRRSVTAKTIRAERGVTPQLLQKWVAEGLLSAVRIRCPSSKSDRGAIFYDADELETLFANAEPVGNHEPARSTAGRSRNTPRRRG